MHESLPEVLWGTALPNHMSSRRLVDFFPRCASTSTCCLCNAATCLLASAMCQLQRWHASMSNSTLDVLSVAYRCLTSE